MSDLYAPEGRGHWLPVCIGAGATLVVLTLAISGLTTAGLVAASFALGAWAAFIARRRSRVAEDRLEDALEISEALERANAELRRFAPSVSHDLRAPLVSTAGFLEMAKNKAQAGEMVDALALLDRAALNTTRMDQMIREFLGLALGDPSRGPEEVSLDEVVAQSLGDLAPALERHGFQIATSNSLGVVLGPRLQIQQVFDNLIGNATKHAVPTEPGLRPVLRIDSSRGSEGRLLVHIADNGPGMESRGRRAGKASGEEDTGAGLGLGLDLVKRGMGACGGGFSIQSPPGGGTVIALEFQVPTCLNQPPTHTRSRSSSSRTMQTTA